MDDLDRLGAALERIAEAMEKLLFWVKVVVLAGLAYVVLIVLFIGIVGLFQNLRGGPMGF
ncbi:MAG: hypothetical protein OXG81_06170 [Acidobacteria bacterium]|nr:hypothetical protein [Acidobacteriota bacterium]MCY3964649.1 hypothetical protein [Acidobacteriota bacterium]